jgi:hypothetical protein
LPVQHRSHAASVISTDRSSAMPCAAGQFPACTARAAHRRMALDAEVSQPCGHRGDDSICGYAGHAVAMQPIGHPVDGYLCWLARVTTFVDLTTQPKHLHVKLAQPPGRLPRIWRLEAVGLPSPYGDGKCQLCRRDTHPVSFLESRLIASCIEFSGAIKSACRRRYVRGCTGTQRSWLDWCRRSTRPHRALARRPTPVLSAIPRRRS